MRNPDNVVIELQECGCDFPDAKIISGKLQIPDLYKSKYANIDTTEINFSNEDFNIPDLTVLFSHQIEIAGTVTGIDTIDCSVNNCVFVPKLKIKGWLVHGYISRFWFFPATLMWIYFINFLMAIALIIYFVYTYVLKKRKDVKS